MITEKEGYAECGAIYVWSIWASLLGLVGWTTNFFPSASRSIAAVQELYTIMRETTMFSIIII